MSRLQTAKGAAFDSYENQHDECLLGTRTKLLSDIEKWAISPQGKCIFWLNGMAGTGKSTISRTVAHRLKENGLLGASFFFKKGEKDRGSAKSLFPTLIEQLMITIPDLIPIVRNTLDRDPNISEKMLKEQFESLIYLPLLEIRQRSTDIMVVVIDALDECDREDDVRLILRLLPQVQKSKSIRLRFLLTSRPELPIRLELNSITDDHQELILHEISEPVIQHDIALYLETKFSQLKRERSLPSDWPGEERIKVLVDRTVPLFIAAVTVCRFVSDMNWDPQRRLQAIIADKSTYVSKMESTYLPILKQLFVGQDKWETQELVQEFKEIVGAIIILATPLSANALSRLLNREPDDIKYRLARLHSVLNIPDSLDAPVRLLHLSFRDFLLDNQTKEIDESNRFWIDEQAVHQSLAIQCLNLMHRSLRRNIGNLPNEATQRIEIDVRSIDHYLPPKLQYACRYWIHHLVHIQGPSNGLVKAISFLEKHLLHWLEAMSLLGILSEVVESITTLKSIAEDYGDAKSSLFLYDVRRFILKCRRMTDIAPLQLYSSGLMFAPTNSITRRIFEHELGNWHRLPEVKESWSTELQTLEGHSELVRAVAFSPSGHLLASGSYDKTIKLWDPTTGELHQTLQGHSDSIQSVFFSSDGKLLASSSNDNTIKLWNPATGELRRTLQGHSDSVRSVAFSSNGKLLASGSNDKTIKLWEPITGKLHQTLNGHSNWIWSVAFSQNDQLLASASFDNTVRIWDVATGKLHKTLKGHSGIVLSVAFSSSSQLLASSSEDNTIKLWDPITGELRQTLRGHSDSVATVAFSANRQLLASGSYDKTIKLWDPTTGELHQTLKGHSYGVLCLAFTTDSQVMVSGSSDKTIKLWNPTMVELREAHKDHSDSIGSIAFSSNGQLLASGSNDKTIRLWNPNTGELHQTLYGHSDSVRSVAFSKDSQLLVSGSNDKTIKLWDPRTGELRRTLQGHSDQVCSVTFSPNGHLLASCSYDKTIKIWNPTSGEVCQTLNGHSYLVRSLAFSPNNQLLASSSYDKTTKLWNPATAELHQTLEGHSGWVWSGTKIEVSIFESQWICLQRERILWLPPDYRPICFALNDGILALGHASGKVSFIMHTSFK